MPPHHPPTVTFPNPTGPRSRPAGGQAGFSLIEVLVSALMVVLIALGATQALVATGHFSADQRYRSQADLLANQDQERLRSFSDEDLNQLQQQSTTRTETVSGINFTVASSASYLSTSGTTGCSTSNAAYYRITSTVSWAEAFSNQATTITDTSIVSRPVAGDLVVQATDQTGANLSGVSIEASGASTQTATTNSSGCVVFAGLTPGAYTVTATDAGAVNPNAVASPVPAAASVTATSPATVNFQLGQAGSIAGTLVAARSSTTTVPGQADGISWIGTSGHNGGMTVPATYPSTATLLTSQTTTPLYPFDVATASPASYTDNYTAWAGRCAGQEPPAPTDEFTVSPGSTGTAQNIQEPLLDVGTVYYKSSSGATATAVTPGHIKLTYTSSTCTDSWYPTVAASMSSSTGWLADPGQPYAPSGTLTVCADYTVTSGRTSTTYQSTATTGNTNFTPGSVNTVPTITITKGSSTASAC